MMGKKEIEKIIIEELPRLLAQSPAFRHQLIGIMAEVFVRKDELKQVLDAIKLLREDFNKRFEEHSKRLEEHSNRLEEMSLRLEEHSKRLEGMSLRLEEHSNYIGQLIKRQEEHSERINELMKRQDQGTKRLESAIGGLGARWGIMSEDSFREGLKGILKELGLKVERYIDYDTEGTVFGRPEQIELDIVIKDSITLLAEIKSSISREEIYVFQRKVEFYERKKGIKVTRKAVISPFVDPRARPIAERLNIEVYTSGYDVRI
ncbi:MAG TPA: DUF3782 domain-containing protein [Candidatus Desulfofervidus auxilii]|uniref:DUF3782 domain-containing protein n=1 Tax=Desulfofervidus auxilii TaxID=1621989 RepID=A0A7C1ZS46_DESA2|nr:DUF3782 domain-containing protein [Candidatus Desulfofervidus auxilii]